MPTLSNPSNCPARLNVLRAYQVQGVEEMLRRKRDILLADEPGLGKTVQVAEYINRTKPESVLIVCPASLRTNWRKELDKWLTHCPQFLRVAGYEELALSTRTAEPLVGWRRNALPAPSSPFQPAPAGSSSILSSPEPTDFSLAVFDEAHYLKNPAAKRTKTCLSLKAGRRLFLTGTPVVNRPMDIYPILHAMGCKLSKTDFGKRFCGGHLKLIRYKPKKYAWDFSGASNLPELNTQLLKSVMIRRTKAEVLTELPPKVRQVIELDIPLDDSTVYKTIASKAYASLSDIADADAVSVPFAEVTKARMEHGIRKVEYVADYLIESLLVEEEKIIIFAHHREVIDSLSAALSLYAPVKLYGGMTDAQKQKAVDEFQKGQSRVFIGQIQSAGTGLTLTASKTVVFAELDWVPGNITQAEDRAHRIGQKDVVRIIHLVAKDSFDAKISAAVARKQEIIEQIVKPEFI